MGELSAQIRADRERLARLIAALPQALVYTDASLLVRFANPSTAELLGELPPGAELPSLVSLFGPGGESVSFDTALRGDREVSAEVAGPAGRIHASWHVVPVRVEDTLDGILLVVTDLREFKAAEAALQAARLDAEVSRETEAARGRFLANVSHELRTPLNAILGYSEMLEEEAEGQDAEDLERILHAGQHLLHLINDLLDLSKIDAGKMTLVPSEFALDRVLEQIVATAEPLAQRGDNRLTVHNRVRRTLRTDETRLRQCLLNLVGNAAKFNSPDASALILEP